MNDMLQKLEDKVITLVDELENMRNKMSTLIRENQSLKTEIDQTKGSSSNNEEKLKSILSLLDEVEKPAEVTAS